ncbi:MAG: FHA domain-containing protein [bacterium]
MQIKLTITSQTDPYFKNDLSTDKFPITIGRDESSSLQLHDPKKMISRLHAKIVFEDNAFKILDMNSRNFTFLNDQKLNPEIGYPLEDGNVIKMSDFRILVKIEKQKPVENNDDRTMLFANPFSEEVEALAKSIRQVFDKYHTTDDDFKKEALQLSLINIFSQLEKNEAGILIAQHIADQFLSSSDFSKSSNSIKAAIPAVQPEQLSHSRQSGIQSTSYSFKAQISRVYDVMFDTLIKLLQGFWHFRQEFFGVTIYQTLPANSVDSIKEFLFSESISVEEENKRLQTFDEEMQKILLHQVGLLEGYKLSLDDGIKQLLISLDPGAIENELKEQKVKLGPVQIPYRFIPFYIKIKTIQIAKARHVKIFSDLTSVEKKYFRQPFMKGYQIRLSSRK